MKPTTSISFCLFLLLCSTARANPASNEVVTSYAREVEIVIQGTHVRTVSTPNAAYQRLRLRVEGRSLDDATVRLNTAGGRMVEQITGEELRQGRWTNVVPGATMELIFSPGTGDDVRLIVERVVGQGKAGKLLSQVGDVDETQPILAYREDPIIRRHAQSVAFLSFIKNGRAGVCTGFLMKGGLVTNHHCIATADECESAVAVFGFELRPDGITEIGDQFRCDTIVRSEPDLDLVMLGLAGSPEERFGILVERAEPRSEKAAYIIQHPSGGPKSIAFKNCTVDEVGLTNAAAAAGFSHLCDTGHGSSGSPVFDADGKLIGVHHYGFNDGTHRWSSNRAVRINAAVLPLGLD